jgi:hypothetical protein
VTVNDLAISCGERWRPSTSQLDDVLHAARVADVDPDLVLATLIRESGDVHTFDWLSRTPAGRIHHFSLGIANIEEPAFDAAREFANGAIPYDWSAMQSDASKAIQAAAFLIARLRSELEPNRSSRISDSEYVRIGYRSGIDEMAAVEKTGVFAPGLLLFDIAYKTAGELVDPRDRGEPICTTEVTRGRTDRDSTTGPHATCGRQCPETIAPDATASGGPRPGGSGRADLAVRVPVRYQLHHRARQLDQAPTPTALGLGRRSRRCRPRRSSRLHRQTDGVRWGTRRTDTSKGDRRTA